MAQFDVYRVKGGALVVDCQSDLLNDLSTRFVVPLRAIEHCPIERLTPVFRVNGVDLAMLTPFARGIDVRDIEAIVGSLIDREYEIKVALDMLVSGFSS